MGDTRAGGSCNCEVLTLAPHCNGTHTECVGHLTDERVAVSERLPGGVQLAQLVTVEPVPAEDAAEDSDPRPAAGRPPGHGCCARTSLRPATPGPGPRRSSCARSATGQPLRAYEGPAPAPYLSRQAAAWLVERGIETLVLDLPSADRADDGGRLTAHRVFFGLPPGSRDARAASRPRASITELAWIDAGIADGYYLLDLQIPPFVTDAAPSRPLLYPRAARMSAEQSLEAARARDATDPATAQARRVPLPAPAGRRRGHLPVRQLARAAAAARGLGRRDIHGRVAAARRARLPRSGGGLAEPARAACWRPRLRSRARSRGEAVVMHSLTINLHLLMASFYRPTRERHVILIEQGAFPSDRYAVASQIAWHGFDPATSLVQVGPRAGEHLLRHEDLVAEIGRLGERLALVLLPGVQYLTGQRLDIAGLATAAHRVGALAGFDLAHAIGNLPLALHDWNADFAAWCSYKYLNGGPGATAGAFVHERHFGSEAAAACRLVGQRSRHALRDGGAVPSLPRCRRLAGQQPSAARHGAAAGIVRAVRGSGHAGAARALDRADRLARGPCWRRGWPGRSKS